MSAKKLTCDICGAKFKEWDSPIKGAGFESTCHECFMEEAYKQFVSMHEELKRERCKGGEMANKGQTPFEAYLEMEAEQITAPAWNHASQERREEMTAPIIAQLFADYGREDLERSLAEFEGENFHTAARMIAARLEQGQI